MAGTAGMSAAYAPPNSFGSAVVNGQLVGVQTTGAYYPKNYGGGISATPAGSPITIPPSVGYGQGLMSGRTSSTPIPTASSPGAMGSTTGSTTDRGSYNGPKIGSPAFWAVGLMAFGVLWLRFVHWRKSPRKEA